MYTLLVISLTLLVWFACIAMIFLFCENDVLDDCHDNLKCNDRFSKNKCSDKENCKDGSKSNCTKHPEY